MEIGKTIVATRALLATGTILGFVSGGALGQTFEFSGNVYPPDTIIAFRQVGGAKEVVVNLGPVTWFQNRIAGSTNPLVGFSPSQLSNCAFSSLDLVEFSVFAGVTQDGNTNFPAGTVWATKPRTTVGVQNTKPWKRASAAVLGQAATALSGIGENGVPIGQGQKPGLCNTTNLVTEASGAPGSFGVLFGGNGDFAATFQGDVENEAPANFVEAHLVIQSDFYQIVPGASSLPAVYLGYFEFDADGVITFVAAGGAIPAPQVTFTGVSQSASGATTVTFTNTIPTSKYTLLRSGNLEAALSTWTTVGAAVAGASVKTTPVSLTDASVTGGAFYRIQATP